MEKDVILTIKERMFLKKLDMIIHLLEEIYGKMCGENPLRFPDDARRLNPSIEDNDEPF
jgi:hypothetical protein